MKSNFLVTGFTKNFIYWLILLVFVSPAIFAGGPWTQSKSAGFAQLSYSLIPDYRSLYQSGSSSDAIQLNRDVTDITLSLYFEHGLADNLTVVGVVPYKRGKTSGETFSGDFSEVLDDGSLNGIGNISAGLKYNKKTLLVSGSILVDANTGKNEAATGLRTGYDGWGIAPVISIGGSRNNFYAFIDSGLRFRTNSYSNEFLLNGEAGVQLFNRLWVIGVLDIRQSINDGTADNENAEQTGLYPDNQEFVAPGFKLIYDIHPRFGINFSRFGAFSGNLVAKKASSTLGVYLRW